jgi:methyl-accepting chemotaxis protein
MNPELAAFLIRTAMVGSLLIGFLYWRFRDALLTKVMVAITPFLLVMSTSTYLNAQFGKTVSWLPIAGPLVIIGVGVLSILYVNKFTRTMLNDLLKQLRVVAKDLADTTGALSDKSKALNEGAARQERSVAGTEDALKKGMKSLEESLLLSKTARQESATALKSFQEGTQLMAKFRAAIARIDENAGRSGSLVKTIEGIALQTNILSLNAAVEAQRAGSAGQGFAVVADEVRALAGKVTVSTKDINNLMEDTRNHSRESTELAASLQAVVKQFEQSIAAFDATIQQMADLSERQRASMLEIHDGIRDLVEVARTLQNAGETSAEGVQRLLVGIDGLAQAQHGLESMVNGSAAAQKHA